MEVLLGEYVPKPPDHIPVVTPVTEPTKFTVGLFAQLVTSGPAFAVIGAVKVVTVTLVLADGQLVLSKISTEYVPAGTEIA